MQTSHDQLRIPVLRSLFVQRERERERDQLFWSRARCWSSNSRGTTMHPCFTKNAAFSSSVSPPTACSRVSDGLGSTAAHSDSRGDSVCMGNAWEGNQCATPAKRKSWRPVASRKSPAAAAASIAARRRARWAGSGAPAASTRSGVSAPPSSSSRMRSRTAGPSAIGGRAAAAALLAAAGRPAQLCTAAPTRRWRAKSCRRMQWW